MDDATMLPNPIISSGLPNMETLHDAAKFIYVAANFENVRDIMI